MSRPIDTTIVLTHVVGYWSHLMTLLTSHLPEDWIVLLFSRLGVSEWIRPSHTRETLVRYYSLLHRSLGQQVDRAYARTIEWSASFNTTSRIKHAVDYTTDQISRFSAGGDAGDWRAISVRLRSFLLDVTRLVWSLCLGAGSVILYATLEVLWIVARGLRVLGLLSITSPLGWVVLAVVAWKSGMLTFIATILGTVFASLARAFGNVVVAVTSPVIKTVADTLEGPMKGVKRKRWDRVKPDLIPEENIKPPGLGLFSFERYLPRTNDAPRPLLDSASGSLSRFFQGESVQESEDDATHPYKLTDDMVRGGKWVRRSGGQKIWESAKRQALKPVAPPYADVYQEDITVFTTSETKDLQQNGEVDTAGTSLRAGAAGLAGFGTASYETDTVKKAGLTQQRHGVEASSTDYLLFRRFDLAKIRFHVDPGLLEEIRQIPYGLSSGPSGINKFQELIKEIGDYSHDHVYIGVTRTQTHSGTGDVEKEQSTALKEDGSHVGGAGIAPALFYNVNVDQNNQHLATQNSRGSHVDVQEVQRTQGGDAQAQSAQDYRKSVRKCQWNVVHVDWDSVRKVDPAVSRLTSTNRATCSSETFMLNRLCDALRRQIEDAKDERLELIRIATKFATLLVRSVHVEVEKCIASSRANQVPEIRKAILDHKYLAAQEMYGYLMNDLTPVQHGPISLDPNQRANWCQAGGSFLHIAGAHLAICRDQTEADAFCQNATLGWRLLSQAVQNLDGCGPDPSITTVAREHARLFFDKAGGWASQLDSRVLDPDPGVKWGLEHAIQTYQELVPCLRGLPLAPPLKQYQVSESPADTNPVLTHTAPASASELNPISLDDASIQAQGQKSASPKVGLSLEQLENLRFDECKKRFTVALEDSLIWSSVGPELWFTDLEPERRREYKANIHTYAQAAVDLRIAHQHAPRKMREIGWTKKCLDDYIFEMRLKVLKAIGDDTELQQELETAEAAT